MGLYAERPKRFVIPKWREFKNTAKNKELAKLKTLSKNIPKSEIFLNAKYNKWLENKNIINAIELVNLAFLYDNYEIAKPSAELILNFQEPLTKQVKEISQIIIDPNYFDKKDISEIEPLKRIDLKIQPKIHNIRLRLSKFPQNALLWIDLALWYSVIGKFYDALKAIKIAIQLASDNLFVIRASVRFFIHNEKRYKEGIVYAYQLIRENPITKMDPWLLATEISLASYLKKTSNNIKLGRNMIDDSKFSPFSISELSATIATEELKAGNFKNSRKLFRKSLIDPNDNAAAQAEWGYEIMGIEPISLGFDNFYEFNSYLNYLEGKWDESFSESLNWIVDQPFSEMPVNFSSFIAAAIIDDNEKAIDICNFGLRANPKEFALLNNKSYSLAVSGKIKQAEKCFAEIQYNDLKENEKIVYLATKGLIHYANNLPNQGNEFYNEALQKANNAGNSELFKTISIFKIRVEYLFGYMKKPKVELLNELKQELNISKDHFLIKLINNVISKIDDKL